MALGRKDKKKQLGGSSRMAANGASGAPVPAQEPEPDTEVDEEAMPETEVIEESEPVADVEEIPETAKVVIEVQNEMDVAETDEGKAGKSQEEARFNNQSVVDYLGRERNCFKCKELIEKVGDIRVARYFEGEPKPGDAIFPFIRSLFMRYHEHCIGEVEEAVILVGGDVVGELKARKSAQKRFLDLIADGGPALSTGCIFCGTEDPGDDAEKWERNRTLEGFPPELWKEDGIPDLKGKQVCHWCNLEAMLAGCYTKALMSEDDYVAYRIKQLAAKHNGGHNGGRQRQNTR